MLDAHKSGPATASPLNRTWLRLRGRDRWLPVTATVYSSEYEAPGHGGDGVVGFYTVVYSYSAGGALHTGSFVDFGRADESYFRRNDPVEVRYNPHHPAQSYYPEARTRTTFHLVCAGLGAGMAVIVVAVRWWSQHGRL